MEERRWRAHCSVVQVCARTAPSGSLNTAKRLRGKERAYCVRSNHHSARNVLREGLRNAPLL